MKKNTFFLSRELVRCFCFIEICADPDVMAICRILSGSALSLNAQ